MTRYFLFWIVYMNVYLFRLTKLMPSRLSAFCKNAEEPPPLLYNISISSGHTTENSRKCYGDGFGCLPSPGFRSASRPPSVYFPIMYLQHIHQRFMEMDLVASPRPASGQHHDPPLFSFPLYIFSTSTNIPSRQFFSSSFASNLRY